MQYKRLALHPISYDEKMSVVEPKKMAVVCLGCRVEFAKPFDQACNACVQGYDFLCEKCDSDGNPRGSLHNCSGCGYRVCDVHSKSFYCQFYDLSVRNFLSIRHYFCIFGDGTITACHNQYRRNRVVTPGQHWYSEEWMDTVREDDEKKAAYKKK
jgi:hypothetical protein